MIGWFSFQMEKKLEANSRKSGWWNCSLRYLLMRATQERKELNKALKRKDAKQAIEECADCANFYAMIADNIKDDRYDWED